MSPKLLNYCCRRSTRREDDHLRFVPRVSIKKKEKKKETTFISSESVRWWAPTVEWNVDTTPISFSILRHAGWFMYKKVFLSNLAV